MGSKDSTSQAREAARARWAGTTPEQRSAEARERLLKAAVTSIERRTADLTDDQVERLIVALAESPEGD